MQSAPTGASTSAAAAIAFSVCAIVPALVVGDQQVKPYHCVFDYYGNFVLEMESPRA